MCFRMEMKVLLTGCPPFFLLIIHHDNKARCEGPFMLLCVWRLDDGDDDDSDSLIMNISVHFWLSTGGRVEVLFK